MGWQILNGLRQIIYKYFFKEELASLISQSRFLEGVNQCYTPKLKGGCTLDGVCAIVLFYTHIYEPCTYIKFVLSSPLPPFWGLKMIFYGSLLTHFLSSPLTSSVFFSGPTKGWKTSFMHREFGEWYHDIWRKGCWESIICNHNFQGYALI